MTNGPGGSRLVVRAVDDGDILGVIAIDTTIRGRSRGGLRMSPGVGEDELRLLARSMTLKYGFLGLPQGGAKAGLRGDPDASPTERAERLEAFARATTPILRSGLYLPDADMGVTPVDVRRVVAMAGIRPKRREWRVTRAGFYTGLTVRCALRQAAARVDRPLAGATVAIQGFGSVGGATARLARDDGARVVAVSTSRGGLHDPAGLDVERLAALVAEHGSAAVDRYAGADRIEPGELLALEVDFLCPCANHHAIDAAVAARVAARAICPGANAPTTPEAERVLHERGVLSVPDFLANCGGVLGGTMRFAGVSARRIAEAVDGWLAPRIGRILDEARDRGVAPWEVAVPIALRGFEEVRRRAERPSPTGRLLDLGIGLHRRGWIPPFLVGALAPRWFERAIVEVG